MSAVVGFMAQLEHDLERVFVRDEEPAPYDADEDRPRGGSPYASFFRDLDLSAEATDGSTKCAACGLQLGEAPPPVCDACWCRRQDARATR